MKAYVDSFVEKSKGNNPQNYSQYNMTFYKYTSITNNKHIKNNSRDLDWYSQNNDKVYSFEFYNCKLSLFEYKNGKIIYPISNVTVE